MIDRDVVIDRVEALLASVRSREGVQGAAMLERVLDGLRSSDEPAEIALHCQALGRALRGIESQGNLSAEEFTFALEIHEEIDSH